MRHLRWPLLIEQGTKCKRDAVVEEASSMGIKFEFKGHWWKSV